MDGSIDCNSIFSNWGSKLRSKSVKEEIVVAKLTVRGEKVKACVVILTLFAAAILFVIFMRYIDRNKPNPSSKEAEIKVLQLRQETAERYKKIK